MKGAIEEVDDIQELISDFQRYVTLGDFVEKIQESLDNEKLEEQQQNVVLHHVQKAVQRLRNNSITGEQIPQNKYKLQFWHDCTAKDTICRHQKNCRLCKYSLKERCKENKHLKRRYCYEGGDEQQFIPLTSECGSGLKMMIVDEFGQCVVDAAPFDIEISIQPAYKHDNSQENQEILSYVGIQMEQKDDNEENNLTLSKSVMVGIQDGVVDLQHLQLVIQPQICLKKLPRLVLCARQVEGSSVNLSQKSILTRSFAIIPSNELNNYLKTDFPGVLDKIFKLDYIQKDVNCEDENAGNSLIIRNLNEEQAEQMKQLCKKDRNNNQFICISKVIELYQVLRYCEERDSEFRDSICKELQWSPFKWNQIWNQVSQTVRPDQRRIWKSRNNPNEGLIYSCVHGALVAWETGELNPPTAVWSNGQEKPLETLSKNLYQVHKRAMKDWWQEGHPNWEAYNAPVKTSQQQAANQVPDSTKPAAQKPPLKYVLSSTLLPKAHANYPHLQMNTEGMKMFDSPAQQPSMQTQPQNEQQEGHLLSVQWKTFVAIVAAMRDQARDYSIAGQECLEKVKDLADSGLLTRCLEAILPDLIGQNNEIELDMQEDPAYNHNNNDNNNNSDNMDVQQNDDDYNNNNNSTQIQNNNTGVYNNNNNSINDYHNHTNGINEYNHTNGINEYNNNNGIPSGYENGGGVNESWGEQQTHFGGFVNHVNTPSSLPLSAPPQIELMQQYDNGNNSMSLETNIKIEIKEEH